MAKMSILKSLENYIGYKIWNIWNHSYDPPLNSEIPQDIKIFVITHRDMDLPEIFADKRIYVPLRVNNKMNPTRRTDWLADDSGENISHLNELINEITGIWWVAKHYEELGNPPFVGFNHYRRFLQWKPELIGKDVLISTSGFYLRNKLEDLAKDNFPQLFRREFMAEFSNDESGLVQDYDSYFMGHTTYYSNLFITDRETFFRYFSFLERCLGFVCKMISSQMIPLDGMTPYKRRVYSFFLESMTSLWIYHERKGRRIKHVTTMETRFDIPNLETSLT